MALVASSLPSVVKADVADPVRVDSAKAISVDAWKLGLREVGDRPAFLVPLWRQPRKDLLPPPGTPTGDPDEGPGIQPQAALPQVISQEGMSGSEWSPPDPTIAGGLNEAVLAINDNVRIVDRLGSTLTEFDMNDLTVTQLGWDTNLIFVNPKVIWDPTISRFVMTWNRFNPWADWTLAENHLVVMVSKTATPSASGWFIYLFDSEDDTGDPSRRHALDLPQLGSTQGAVCVSGRMRPWQGSGGTGTYEKTMFFEQADAAAGAEVTRWTFTEFSSAASPDFNLVPAQMQTVPLQDGRPLQYLVGAKESGGTTLSNHRFSIDPITNEPTYLGVDVIPVGTYVPPPDLAQSGAGPVENLSPQILSSEYQNGFLYANHAVGLLVAGEFRSALRPIKIEVTAGNIVRWSNTFSGLDFDYGFPDLAINSADVAFMSYVRGGDSTFLGQYYAFRRPADMVWDGSYVIQTGVAPYSVGAPVLWGRSSGASRDPQDGVGFWAFGMFASAPNAWSTWVSRFSQKPAAIVTPLAASVPLTQAVNLRASVTNGDTGAIVEGKSVTFAVEGVTLGSATTNSLGVATIGYTAPLVDPTVFEVRGQTFEDNTFLGDIGTGSLSITKHTPVVTVPTVSTAFGEDVTLRAMLKRASDQGAIEGETITFFIAGTNVGTALTDATGEARLVNTTDYGPQTLPTQARFAGSLRYNAAQANGQYTIGLASTNLTVPDRTGTINTPVPLEATLRRNHDQAPVNGRLINFTIGGVLVNSVFTNAQGVASFNYTMPSGPAGPIPMTCSFAGDTLYTGSEASATVTRRTNTIVLVSEATGERQDPVTLLANLKTTPENEALEGMTLSFTVAGTPVGTAVTNAQGDASLQYIISPSLVVGFNPVEVTFAGQGNYNADSGVGGLIVQRYQTVTTAVDAVGVETQTIQLQGFLKRVKGNLPLSGRSLIFSVAGVGIGGSVTDANGRALRLFLVPAGPIGPETITVSFPGDGDHFASSDDATFTRVSRGLGGQVDLQAWGGTVEGQQVVLDIYSITGTFLFTVSGTLDEFGRWFIPDTTLPAGAQYRIGAKASHWLTDFVTIFVGPLGNTGMSHSLRNGDVDGDDEIGPGDFGLLANAFLSVSGDPNWDVRADLDGDVEVGPGDFGILAANFLATGEEP